jgi:hypothetical protein
MMPLQRSGYPTAPRGEPRAKGTGVPTLRLNQAGATGFAPPLVSGSSTKQPAPAPAEGAGVEARGGSQTLQEVQMKSLKVITEIEGKVAKEQEKSKRDLAEMAATLMTLRHEAAGHQKQQSMMEGQLQTAMEENEALAQRKRFGCF